jgi:hypothetical protein
VDTFAAVVNSLPGNYGYLVAPFGSFASSPSSSNYASAQKLAFVYRKSMVRNPHGRAMLASSTSAYRNFSSGRFPYQVDAEILGKDSLWHRVSFVIIHAKAYTDDASCSRRIEACQELKDSLDRYFPATPFLILGDFNDDLDVTNCDASFAESNYAAMVNDSTHYKALTLPISRAGAFSIDGYTSLIDHVIASDEMAGAYVPGSAEVLRTLVKSVEPAYDTKISDHFPVRTRYVLDAISTSVEASQPLADVRTFPNPAYTELHIAGAGAERYTCTLHDLSGRSMIELSLTGSGIIDVRQWPRGIYVLQVATRSGSVHRLIHIGQ